MMMCKSETLLRHVAIYFVGTRVDNSASMPGLLSVVLLWFRK